MSAYEEGDYATALPKLSYYLSRNQDDIEALLAFAEVRSRVPDVNNRHTIEAIGLYRAALRLDQVNREALEQILQLYMQIGRRPEHMEIAGRLLALDARDVAALEAMSIGLFHDGRAGPGRGACRAAHRDRAGQA